MIIKSRAPNRILDFGGWTDTWFAGSGAVLNFAVSLYAHATVKRRRRPGVSITAQDFGEVLEIPDAKDPVYDGQHDLLKAAVRVMQIDRVDVSVYSDVPPGCGTGSSAAVSVALLGALAAVADRHYTAHEIAALAHRLETQELGIESGVQDQIASAAGGIGLHQIDPYPRVASSPVHLGHEVVWELESRLLVVYTGERRLSGDVHKKVIGDYQAGVPAAVAAMETLKQAPRRALAALYEGNLKRFAEVMNENDAAQRALHKDIETPPIRHLRGLTHNAGAIGFKINGAGGGGSVTILCGADRRRAVAQAVHRAQGFQILPCHLDFGGLRVWRSAG